MSTLSHRKLIFTIQPWNQERKMQGKDFAIAHRKAGFLAKKIRIRVYSLIQK